MSNSSDLCDEEQFSSFLAGVLLTRREISNPEFCKLMNEFSDLYSTNIVGIDGTAVPVLINNSGFSLINDYDDIIVFNKKKMTVRRYLNLIASSRVKEFFKLCSENKKSNDVILLNIKKLIRKI